MPTCSRHCNILRLPPGLPTIVLALALLLGTGLHNAHAQGHVQVEGTWVVMHEDYPDGSGRYVHHLETAAERLSLRFAGEPPALHTGARVRVTGARSGRVLALNGSGSVQTLSQVVPNT